MPVSGMVEWGIVQASKAAQRTVNPIRQIVDRLKVPPNPAKPLISLGLGTAHPFLGALNLARHR